MTEPESKLSLWMTAVSRGDVAEVRALFNRHPELAEHVNEPLFAFDSPALFACRDNLELVDLLIEHGADLNKKTDWWAGGFGIIEGVDASIARPLIERGAIVDIWAAVALDDLERVEELLDGDPGLVRARGGDGKHPIHYAASPKMVDLLVDRGADVNAKDIDHESAPVQYLVNNEPVVRRLLEYGAAPDIFLAAALGDVKMAKHCLALDPSALEARLGSDGWEGHIYNWTLDHDLTPHDVALERGHTSVLEMLLAHSSSERRLAFAAWQGDEPAVLELVRTNPDIIDRLMRLEPAMMAQAAWWYRPDAVRMLIDLGFDPHLTGVHESTPLDRAAFHGYSDIIEILLDADPEPPVSLRNEFGGTPLSTCVYGSINGWDTGHPRDHVASARLLIEAGCSFSSAWLPTGNDEIDALLEGYLRG
ncbi:MAG: hypothetical protein KJO98_00970 [Rhodothermia bacterium]|nr:hypothetical protein [Rhodothermia bacterium]